MLDRLISTLREEVAVDGPSGTSIDVFWDYVQNLLVEVTEKAEIKKVTPTVDENYKQFIWNYIKLDPELEFYEKVNSAMEDSENDEIMTDASSKATSTSPQGTKRKAPEKSSENETSVEAKDDRKSKKEAEPNIEETVNLKPIENVRNMKYSEIKAYGMSFHLVATTKLQEEQLYTGLPANTSLSGNLMAVLKLILRSRYKGVYQSEISKIFGIDGRSTGHYCKSLEEKGCIIRNGVSVVQTRTNICLHTRFATEKKSVDLRKAMEDQGHKHFYNVNVNNQSFDQNQLRDAMIDLMKDAPGHRILGTDVLQLLGFTDDKSVRSWFNRSLNELCLKGYFKKTNLKIDNKGKLFRCIHLLKVPTDQENGQVEPSLVEDITFPYRIKSSKGSEVPILHYLHDFSFLTQLYQVIEASGTQGVTAKDIMFALNTDENRLLYKVLEDIIRASMLNKGYYSIQREFEFEGRSRRYRYFTKEFYLKTKENKEQNLPMLPEMPYNFPSCEELNPLIKPSKEKTKQRKTESKKKPAKKILKTKDSNTKNTDSTEVNQESQTSICMAVDQSQLILAPEKSLETPQITPKTVEETAEDIQEISLETTEASILKSGTTGNTEEKKPAIVNTSKQKQLKETTSKKKRQSGIADFFAKQQKPEASKINTVNAETKREATPELDPVVIIPTSPILKSRTSALPATKTTSKEKDKPAKISAKRGFEMKRYSHKKDNVNSYMEQRIQVFEMYLEKEPFIEIDMCFIKRFQGKLKELSSGCSNGTVCRKTLKRTAAVLEKRGRLSCHSLECTTFSGVIVVRHFVMRNDFTVESPEYKEYLDFLKSRYMFHNPCLNPATFDTISIPVERVEERIDRMNNTLEEMIASGDTKKIAALKQQIEIFDSNRKRFKKQKPKVNSQPWLITAVQYGYNPAILMRVKAMHKYLLSLLTSSEKLDGLDKKNNKITTDCILANLPFLTICEVFGLCDSSERTKQYYAEHRENNTIVSQMPHFLRKYMISKGRLKSKFQNIFNFLVFLKLVSPDGFQETQFRVGMGYSIHTSVNLVNEKKRNTPLVRSFTLLSDEAIDDFWSTVSGIYREFNNIEQEPSEYMPSDKQKAQIIETLSRSKSWSDPGIYSRPHRRILNSYVDKKKNLTPLHNDRLMHEIALDIGYPVAYIRKYYDKVEAFLNHRRALKEIKKFEHSMISRSRKNRHTNAQSGRFIPKANERYQFESLKTRRTAHVAISDNEPDSAPFMDDQRKVPKFKESDMFRFRKTRQCGWNEEEDDILFYSVVVMKHRGKRVKGFRWAPISKVISKSVSACKNRSQALIKNISYAEKLTEHIDKWDQIYRKGIVAGEIEDVNPYDVIEYDLLGYVSYFIQKISEETDDIQYTQLPRNSADLRAFYSTKVVKESGLSIEERYHQAQTMRSKADAILKRSFTSSRNKTENFDKPVEYDIQRDLDDEEKQISKFRSLVLASLFTPEEKFDPYASWLMLQSFSPQIYEKSLTGLLKSGVLRQKGINDRALPGTRNVLSFTFLRTFATKMPEEVFFQAKEYHAFLNKKDEVLTLKGETISSGMMLCMLDLVSRKKLLLNMKNRTKHLGSKLNALEYQDFTIDHKKTTSPNTSATMTYSKPRLERITVESLDSMADSLIDSMPKANRSLTKKVINILKERGSQGIMLHELKEALEGLYTDQNIYCVLCTLKDNETPLVYVVGYHTVRYVLNSFVDEWVLSMNANNEPRFLKPPEIETSFTSNQSKKPREETNTLPAPWTDLSGSVINTLFQSYCRSVVELIVRKPGITNSSILKSYNGYMTRKELHDILTELVNQSAIMEKTVIVDNYVKPTVFSRTRVIRSAETPLEIAKWAQTSYWPNPECYRQIE
ncbi:hypothetical protein BY458DRAFT_451465 [Sporodiniella umbellata]|nr:hypothetical protein BY458DRAFT_451465 [Sporodiniella umbellata]